MGISLLDGRKNKKTKQNGADILDRAEKTALVVVVVVVGAFLHNRRGGPAGSTFSKKGHIIAIRERVRFLRYCAHL